MERKEPYERAQVPLPDPTSLVKLSGSPVVTRQSDCGCDSAAVDDVDSIDLCSSLGFRSP